MTTPFREEFRIFGKLPVFLDFETFYGDGYSLTDKNMTYYEYVKDPRFQVIGCSFYIPGDHTPHWVPNHNDAVRAYLAKFDWSDKIVIAHNGMFDGSVMSFHYGIVPGMLGCTMYMARPLFEAYHGVSLEKVMKALNIGTKGDEVVHARNKRLEHFRPDELARYGEYCNNDTMGCAQAFYIMMKQYQFPKSELRVIDTSIKMYVRPILQLNKGVLETHLADVQAKKETLLADAGVDKDTLMSNDKLAMWFADRGIEFPTKWSAAKGCYVPAFAKTDVEFVEMQEDEDPVVQAVVAARLGVKSTIEETRTIRLIKQADWPAVPIHLNYYAAHTGRYGGAGGVNWQNNGRKSPIRLAMEPPRGFAVLAGDSSQIELRVNMAQGAMYAPPGYHAEANTLELLRTGGDPYCDFAGDIYGRLVTKDDVEERFAGKQGQLSLGYQGGHGALARSMWANGQKKMEEGQRRHIVKVYRAKYMGVKTFWNACMVAIDDMAHGKSGSLGFVGYDQHGIILPNGLRIHFPGLGVRRGDYGTEYFYMQRQRKKRGDVFWESKLFGGKLCENITQALARIIVFYQMNALSQAMPVVCQVHDEVVAVVPEQHALEAKQAMIWAMQQVPEWAKGIPISCEVGYGKNYKET